MTYKIIHTDTHLVIVDPSIREFEEGSYVEYRGSTYRVLSTDDGYYGIDNSERYVAVGVETDQFSLINHIIAHHPINGSLPLSGVDLLPELEGDFDDNLNAEAEDSADLRYASVEEHEDHNAFQNGFQVGYNKAREKYRFTEDDMKKAMELILSTHSEFSTAEDNESNINGIIQSFARPKLPVAFECEMTFTPTNHASGLPLTGHPIMDKVILRNYTTKTTTNEQGQVVWVGKYLYE